MRIMARIFLHQRGKETEFVDLVPDKTVEEFGLECLGTGAFVWLEDADKPLEPGATLTAAGLVDLCQVHVSLYTEVLVKVRYNGKTAEGKFSPAMTVGPIFKWATGPDEFKLTDNQAAQHHFSLCSSQGEVDESVHVACLADEDGVVCFDLLPNERFAG